MAPLRGNSRVWAAVRAASLGALLALHLAAAPAPAPAPQLWVAAPLDVLRASLQELGWQPTPREGGDVSAVLAMRRPRQQQERSDMLEVLPRAEVLHGLPLWQLALASEGDERGELQRQLAGGLLAGIAVMRPARPPLPAVIELRHSAGEIEPMLATGAPAAAGAGAAAPAPGPPCPPRQSCVVPRLPVAAALPSAPGGPTVWRNDRARSCVALTFDACSTMDWGPFNPQVIEVLRREGIEATLFLGGHWAELHAEQLVALSEEPLFELGNHTYSHPHLTELSPTVVRQQVLWAQWAIFSRTNVLPTLLRPPYGEVDAAVADTVAALGLRTVQFDLPAGDADVHVSAERLTEWVGRKSRPGSIVVMHMNRPGNKTAEALPAIVRRLAERGLRPCRVSDLLAEGGAG